MSTNSFETGQSVVHPAHGVGCISGMETQEIAGQDLELYVIAFARQKLTLRIPATRLVQDGIRPLASHAVVASAIETLATPSKVRQADQYRLIATCEERIKSGDLVAIANVARDLYRAKSVRETPFTIENTFQIAVTRLADEIALINDLDEPAARSLVMSSLIDDRPPD